MKLYTRTGDDGTTGLYGPKRVNKDDLRIEAFGTVDQLNSHIGLAIAACRFDELTAILTTLQNQLFVTGADLATPVSGGIGEPGGTGGIKVARIEVSAIEQAEQQIDLVCESLPAMTHFILPGGSELASRLHVARTVCRRAERLCVTLDGRDGAVDQIVIYLNRLSDLLFAMARRANQLEDIEDVPWLNEGAKGSRGQGAK
jgi:cob(I)alamin adenosyltransferase